MKKRIIGGLIQNMVFFWGLGAVAQIVITEIHYDPEPDTAALEFIELHNAGATAVDVGGWYFSEGVEYTLPPAISIAAGGYLVIAQDPASLGCAFGIVALGPWSGKLNNDGEMIELRDAQGAKVDSLDYRRGFPWPVCPGGSSMELVNPALDGDLGGSWRSSGGGSGLPSPGLSNQVWMAAAPPAPRQVGHSPEQPKSGEAVVISAKVTSPQGVQDVALEYQLVAPGAYVRATDAAYNEGWISLAMVDDGTEGDIMASDDVYSATIPASIQLHRHLVRYRITVADTTGLSQRVPYEDDLRRNFSYFVYDGVPAWTGANDPGTSPEETFSTNVMANALPVYHLLAIEEDVLKCQYNRGYEETHFYGTLVYDGQVYDHIQFKVRGEWDPYVSGKNKWRFYFNQADDLVARDNYGHEYEHGIRHLNFNGCASPWLPANRGMAGLDEAGSFRMCELAGMLSPSTHYAHFRVIDDSEEAPENDQYGGDLWGLYLAIEHIDGRFLDERDLPDGNTYKIIAGGEVKRNQGATQSEDSSDWDAFCSNADTNPPVAWWRANFDLDSYYSFLGINRVVSNVDFNERKNFGMYHHPAGPWHVIPQDLDLMFAPETHWPTIPRMKNCLAHAELSTEFKNRCRELMDLLLSDPSPMGGQAVQVMHELAQWVNPTDQAQTFADVDQFVWNYHPRTTDLQRGKFYVTPMVEDIPQGGPWTRTLVSADFEGFVQYISDFVTDTDPDGFTVGDGDQRGYGFNHLEQEAADSAIPATPTLSYTGSDGFPVDALQFESSTFADPQGSGTFGALQWRIAEIRNPATPGYEVGDRWKYEIDAYWESGSIATADYTLVPPVDLVSGRTYRVRVRHQDSSNRWSHWSDPVEFVAMGIDALRVLLVSEVHYNPADPASGSTYDNDDFEFVELQNTGTEPLNLRRYALDGGIGFSFGNGSVETLAAGGFVVVVRDLAAFASRYATNGMQIAGTYSGKLANSGENIRLEFYGQKVFDIAFNDAWGWPQAADGGGPSLVPLTGDLASQGFDILDYPGNWRASTYVHGSPGEADPEPSAGIVINEVVAHTDTGEAPPNDSNDQVELYNPTDADIALDGDWYLSDDLAEPEKYNIPASTVIPAGGWVEFDEEGDFHVGGMAGFGLDKAGEQIVLSHRPGSGLNRVVDCIGFKGQANGASWGRYPDGDAFLLALSPTVGSTNQLAPAGIRIEQLMYHPLQIEGAGMDAVLEYILLTNRSSQAVVLEGEGNSGSWRIGGGVDYAFPGGESMAAGEKLWLVPFNPATDPGGKTLFCATYGLDAGSVRLFGPYAGNLSNSGGRIALERPQASDDPLFPNSISWIIEDEITWLDEAPWPDGADGTGMPLVRIGFAGNDPRSWMAPLDPETDTDGDGMPDVWELKYFGNPTNCVATGNPDGDLHNNLQESITGTDPTNSSSFFSIAITNQIDGFSISWTAVEGRFYSILRASDLEQGFQPLEYGIAFPQNSYTDTLNGAEDKGYYKVDVLQQ